MFYSLIFLLSISRSGFLFLFPLQNYIFILFLGIISIIQCFRQIQRNYFRGTSYFPIQTQIFFKIFVRLIYKIKVLFQVYKLQIGYNLQTAKGKRNMLHLAEHTFSAGEVKICFTSINLQPQDYMNLEWRVAKIAIFKDNAILATYVDETKRKSLLSSLSIPETNNKQFNGGPIQWIVAKYVNTGFFQVHIDQKEDPNHIGNQILIPPQSQLSYEGGALALIDDEGKKLQIFPDATRWTHIFIPYGVRHQVEEVKGTRISFVRFVFDSKACEYVVPACHQSFLDEGPQISA